MTINEKIASLRQKMSQHGVQAIIIPSADPHQSEYVAEHWKSRAWISGFTGSAGTAVITMDHAGLWTDSRYYLQAGEELADSEFLLHKVINYSPDFIPYLIDNLPKDAVVACDGNVFSKNEIESYKKQFTSKKIKVKTGIDLVNEIWVDRPPMPENKVFYHGDKYAKTKLSEKLATIRKEMEKSGAKHYLLSTLDDIAWTFNLRGSDVDCNPVFISYALVSQDKAQLFVGPNKIDNELKSMLSNMGVELQAYDQLSKALSDLDTETSIYLSGAGVNYNLYNSIKCKVIDDMNIVEHLKSIKTDDEVQHFRNAMEKDGVALIKLYMWLEETLKDGETTEYELGIKLNSLRSQQDGFNGDSFGAIAGYNANGAIVHYGAEKDTCATIKNEGILLLDSGGQYLDGTTDITRTTALGSPTPEQKKYFTLVLKGHIAIDQLVFPEGTNGYQLDILARQFLWKDGVNYFHGTGHGVGYFLNVHEGPHGISFVLSDRSKKPMLPGMVTSNEPGFYKDGEFGIRIENLILTKKVNETEFGTFLGSETLTLFPIDQKLIETSLLTRDEINWLNDYHKMVYDRLETRLNEEEKQWLAEQCKSIERI